jgi:hypothetical protein
MTIPAFWDVIQCSLCPELLSSITKTLVTSAFLRQEICAQCLHNMTQDANRYTAAFSNDIQAAGFINTMSIERHKVGDIPTAS